VTFSLAHQCSTVSGDAFSTPAHHGLQIADLDPQLRQFPITPFQLTSKPLDLGGMSLTDKR
jgi:hypothetical protein